MFSGDYTNTIDAKGRVIIPSRFRETALAAGEGTDYYLASGRDGHVCLFTARQWAEETARLNTGMFVPREEREFNRYFIGSAVHVVPDSQGRILIPESMRTRASLKKSVTFVGQVSFIEVWDTEEWKSFHEEFSRSFEERAEQLSNKLSEQS